jgi:8-oxo-dGTP pyrophosphatase MutT (NUDIX family)
MKVRLLVTGGQPHRVYWLVQAFARTVFLDLFTVFGYIKGMMATMDGPSRLAGWQALRDRVEAAGRTLDDAALEQAEALFLAIEGEESAADPGSLTSEYARDEFLLALDGQGAPAGLSATALEQARELLDAHPAFRRWFRPDRLPGGAPVLLAARWLCHLAGIRHATVEVFIDPPDMPGFTLAQVRGVDRFEAPAAFDIPCAGHVAATDTVEASLRKELAEELNLSLDDFVMLRRRAWDECCTGIDQTGSAKSVTKLFYPVNIEYRTLYYATIKRGAMRRVRFYDGEVAGLALFSVNALRELIRRFPERVASGLSGSMPFYPG